MDLALDPHDAIILPTALAQERLWFVDRLRPGTAVYNMPISLRLRARISRTVLERCLAELVRRHETLRTTFMVEEGQPVQVVSAPVALPLTVVDLRRYPPRERERRADELAASECRRPFELRRGPLLRATLYRLAAADCVLLLVMHHIVSDAWSMEVLVRELGALYSAFESGAPSPLPPLPVQYADWAHDQRERMSAERLAAELAFWRERLAGAPMVLELPSDRARPEQPSYRGGFESFLVEAGLAERLRTLAQQHGCTLYMVLLAAFGALLSRHAGQSDLLIGSPVTNRSSAEVESLIGLFVNTLVLRVDVRGSPTVAELLARVRARVLDAQAHAEVPLDKLIEALQPERGYGRHPLFQVLFSLQSSRSPQAAREQTAVPGGSRPPPTTGTSKFDLSLLLDDGPGGLAGAWEYSADLFDGARIRRMSAHFVRVLGAFVERPEARVEELSLADEAELRELVALEQGPARRVRTDEGRPRPECLHERVLAQARRTPEAIAVESEHETLRYAELVARATELAGRLRAHGVGPDVRVGLCLRRGAALIVGALAILQAGGAYVPLDPAHPQHRLAYIADDARLTWVVTETELAAILPAGVKPLCIDRPAAHELEAPPPRRAWPGNLAYVLYTSGTTGRPKGVAVPHASAAALLDWAAATFEASQRARVLASTSICFDLSVFEIFLPLGEGGTVVVVEDVLALASGRAPDVTLVNTVPSAMRELVRIWHPGPSLRAVNLAGEALARDLVQRLHERAPAATVYNLYGPTETTVYSTGTALDPRELGVPSIGRPIAGTVVYVLDARFERAPIGVPGELYIGGAGVARGYLGRPGRTAERYLPDPFAGGGARMYRTGDIVCWRPDGTLEYQGRSDHQVKLRGHRIELGEIEAALRGDPRVHDAVAVLRPSASGDPWIVAYVKAGTPAPDPAELEALARRALPATMVPARLVVLDELPRTATGKVDRAALPEPAAPAHEAPGRSPATAVEAAICELFGEILGVPAFDPDGDFFAYGGHSLLATGVVARVNERLGVELPLSAIFEHSSPARLCAHAATLGATQARPRGPSPRAGADEWLPLSFAQEGMWFYDRLRPRSALYNLPVVLPSRGALDPELLQRSIDHVVARHEALRMRFDSVSGKPVQRVVDEARVKLVVHDLRALPAREREARARRIVDRELRRPFDLRRAPLLRAALVRLALDEQIVVFVMHHIISDGWSTDILQHELASCYETLSMGGLPALPALELGYGDYVRWQRSTMSPAFLEERLARIRRELAGAPSLVSLPTDHPRPAQPTFRGGILSFELDGGASEALARIAAAHGATLHMSYLAVFAALLHGYAGQDDVVIGIPMANRGRSEWREVIGLFTNTVPVRIGCGPDPTFATLLERTREAAVAAYAREDLPFDRVVQELSPARALSYHPIFQVMFGFQELGGAAGSGSQEVLGGTDTAKFDLSLSLSHAGGRVSCVLEYATDLFERASMERVVQRYRRMVEALGAEPTRPLATLVPLDDEERAWCAAGRRDSVAPAPALGAAPAPAPIDEARGESLAPRASTEVEQQIAMVWTEILGHAEFAVNQSFFEVGGHSLAAMCVMTRIGEIWGVEIPFERIFITPTIDALARAVQAAHSREGSGEGPEAGENPDRRPELGRVERGPVIPLSFAQERLWFLDQLTPGLPVYNIPFALELHEAVDISALERSLERLSERHEGLRARFIAGAAGPEQVIEPVMAIELAVTDLSRAHPRERRAQAERVMSLEARRYFDLSSGPLLHAHLLSLGAREQLLLLTMHHIVADARSVDIMQRDLLALYEAERLGVPDELPELNVQYADFAIWQRTWLTGERLAAELGYWREKLAGAPRLLALPTDRPRPLVQSHAGEQRPLTLGRETSAEIRQLASEEQATPFMVLFAVFGAVLGRWSGAADLVVGTPVIGRPRRELEELVGFFSNTLPMRLQLAACSTFRELVRHVREVVIEALAHQDVPFEAIVQELQPERTLAHNPLFQAMFAFQRPSEQRPAHAVREGASEAIGSGTAKFDLTLFLVDDAELHGALEYRTDLFEPTTIERFAAHLRAAAEAAVASPDAALAELFLASRSDRAAIEQWNATAVALEPREALAGELCAAAAARSPEAPAVTSATDRSSYAELMRRATALAAQLRGRGLGPDDRVAISIEPSIELVVAVLGTWLAGGACVPLDPRYPAARLAFMVEDCGARWIVGPGLTVEPLGAALEPGAQVGAPRSAGSPEQLAYVIYTSGSTGQPKGVAMTHRALVNLVQWQRGRPERGAARRTLQFASPSFDVFFQELLLCLASGAELVIASAEERRDPLLLLERCRERRVERVFVPFVALRELAEAAASRPPLPELREVITAGEQLQVTPAIRRWFGAHPNARLFNHYGPSETHVITEECLAPDPAQWPALPPIGRAIANARLYVLDGELRPLPVGVPGDLYLGGVGLARGYLDRPALTAERFLPDPHAAEPGARMYRSGDRARWLADGRVEFLGRSDDQVKVRGFRVEVGEVETVLAGLPGVRQAVVLALPDASGDHRLVGYVLGEDASVDASALRQALGGLLPEPLVPAVLVVVDEFPRTPSGKIDRRALPAPRSVAAPTLAPINDVERVVARAWGEVLGLEQVGRDESFFSLGGHSLRATQVSARLRERFDLEIPVRWIFEHPTVAGLAAAIVEAMPAAAATSAGRVAAIPVLPRDGSPLPASFAQERLWFLDQVAPGSPAYDLTCGYAFPASLDVELLRRSLDALVARHEALRTVFREVDGAPVQVIAPAARATLEVVELSALAPRELEAEVACYAEDESRRSFDLRHGPLFRATLLELGARGHVLLLAMHHIISDAWSLKILHRDLMAIYEDLERGRPPSLPRLRVQYADFAGWQREQLGGAALEQLIEAWRRHLAGAPQRLELPTDRPRPTVQVARGGTHAFELDPAHVAGLQALAREEGATLFMTALAVFIELLGRYSRQQDFLVGTPVGARPRAELEEVVGLFVNTLVLRCERAGDPSFRALLGRVRQETIGAYARADLPFERLVEALHPRRDLGVSPLVQVAFGLHHGEDAGPPSNDPASASRAPHALTGNGTAKFDLSLVMTEVDGRVHAVLEYDRDLFEAATIARMATHFEALVQQAIVAPDVAMSEWNLLGAAEARDVLGRWAEGPPRPLDHGLGELVARHAARDPSAPAVEGPDGELGYAELDARVQRLASGLRALGVGAEVRVGVCLGNAVSLPVAFLAILRAGGVYVPLDPALPRARLDYVIQDAAVQVLITDRSGAERLADCGARIVCTDALDALPASDEPPAVLHPEQIAYVVYTSGSTGQPKGVMVTHRGLRALLAAQLHALGLRPADRVLKFATPSFDASVFELALTFAAGATLCLEPQPELHPGPELVALLQRRRITMVTLPPSSLGVLAVEDCPALRLLFVAGEACPAELVARWAPGRRMINGYGPTETTVWASYAECTADGRPPPIGRPVANARVRILDRDLRPVAVGVPGELCIGGVMVARGYLGRPDLTAAAFIPDPWGPPGSRMYRSGDLVRWRADGNIDFLGRIDGQIKLRGVRIEPSEIEAAIASMPGVAYCVVVLREDRPGNPMLVAYVVPTPAAELDGAGIRGALQERLPRFLVPARVIVCEELPRTPSGKLDRRALPAPADMGAEAAAPPQTTAEAAICRICSEVLGVTAGRDDNFFELGGHSLLLTKALSRIRDELGLEIPVRRMFEAATLAELCEGLEVQGPSSTTKIACVPRTTRILATHEPAEQPHE